MCFYYKCRKVIFRALKYEMGIDGGRNKMEIAIHVLGGHGIDQFGSCINSVVDDIMQS